MSTGKKKIEMWGAASLVYAGITAALTLGILLLGLPKWTGGGNRTELWVKCLFLFSTILLVLGFMMQLFIAAGLFQVYFPVILSMGSTRKETIRTFFLSLGANALFMALLAGLAWEIGRYMEQGRLQRELFGIGLPWFFLAAMGVLLLGAALGMIVGAVCVRWRMAAMVLLMVLEVACGVGIGLYMVLYDDPEVNVLLWRRKAEYMWPAISAAVFAAGAALDLCAAASARLLVQKAEIRA